MPVARLAGIDLYYQRAGSGPPLLFIWGSRRDLRMRPGPFDWPLARDFEMVAYDQRGLGQSGKPDAAYSMADYADDAAALIAHQGWENAHVVGVSFGGMVAQELALRHPRRVRRAVFACSSPGGAGGASYPFHEIGHLPPDTWARRLAPLVDIRNDDAWAAANPGAYGQLLSALAADPGADEPGHSDGFRRQLEARAAHDTWDRLPEIRCPVMVAAGRYDGVALPATQEKMAARIPGAILRFFEGGHAFLQQDPNAAPAVAAFLKG